MVGGGKRVYNKQLYNRALLLIAIIIFVITWLLRGLAFNASVVVSTAVTSTGVALLVDQIVLRKILWKIKPELFNKWMTNIPYLGGCWEGKLLSTYIDSKTKKAMAPIDAKIEIYHEIDNISIRMETKNSYSNSYISGVVIDEGKQKFLCYLYVNDADKDRDINPKHDGAVKLRIKHDGELKLEGHYWTGRCTVGKMEFKRISKKNSPV